MSESVKSKLRELERLYHVYAVEAMKIRSTAAEPCKMPDVAKDGEAYVQAAEIARALIVRWRETSSWEEEKPFFAKSLYDDGLGVNQLALFEEEDTEVCTLLMRALGRVDKGKSSPEVRLIAYWFVTAAINTAGVFRKYQDAARASPCLREVPDVKRYLL